MSFKMKKQVDIANELNEENYCFEEPEIINNWNLIKNLSNSSKFPKMFYFNIQIIHNKLYELQEVIKIDNRLQVQNLPFIFYLDLLIRNDPYMINYTYDLDFIRKIVNFEKEEKNLNFLIQIIISKIILGLIYNFKGFYEGDLKEITKIEKENEANIANNIRYLEEINPIFTEKFIKSKEIDEIYCEIIISLIKKDKLSDYEYAFDIMSNLKMEEIDINKLMFSKIKDILNSNENYINKYKIEEIKDVHDPKKINFHYILLKMILKNQIYIYQISFLLKTRLNIIKILKNNNILFDTINEQTMRIEYILKKYTDSQYYFAGIDNSYNKNNIKVNTPIKQPKKIKDNQIIDLNKNSTQNISKFTNIDDRIKSQKETIKNNSDEKNYFINQLFEKLVFILHTSENEKNFIFDTITFGKKDVNIKEKFLQEIYNISSKSSKYQNSNLELLVKFLKNLENKIKNEFIRNYCLNLKLLFEKDKNNQYIKNDNNNKIYNILCIITFYDPLTKKELSFKVDNILEHHDNLNLDSIIYLMFEINNDIFENIKYIPPKGRTNESKSKHQELNTINEFVNESKERDRSINNLEDKERKEEADICQVIIYIKNININTKIKSFECVKEMSYQYFYAYGDKIISILDKLYKKKMDIILDDKILNISERKCGERNHIELIACCSKNLILINIDINKIKYSMQQYQIPNIKCFFCYQMNNDIYMISGEGVVRLYEHLFDSSHDSKSYKYGDKLYHSGIKLSNSEIILTSNNLIKKGENNLIIINIIEKKKVTNIRGYSYVSGPNGIGVMTINNNKIIIAGCKKYFSGQKNGIVLIDYRPDKNENEKIKYKFYETDDFEVNCICPIVDTKNGINNCFLVGGFYPLIGEGKIQLYQIISKEEGFSSLNYLQDIEFELDSEFQGFEMPVSCISQSSIDDKLLVTSLDNNMYLLSKPNLEFYIDK